MEFVDLFCGAGGLSLGLKKAGLRQRLAVDSDPQCVASYRANFPRSNVRLATIETLDAREITRELQDTSAYVLAGGPPCQLFSRLHQQQPGGDHVVFAYLKLVRALRPPYLVFENVPQIASYRDVWGAFLRTLKSSGYHIWSAVINAADLGVPQSRHRLVVVASRRSPVSIVLPQRVHRTVRQAIGDMPRADPAIPNHVTMQLSDANFARIRSIRTAGGNSRFSKGFSDSYARMHWDKPAPTITTRCVSFSNGRFGHPKFDRALTVREAARLQGFPDTFLFEGGVWSTARQVGNAVPPPLAAFLGRQLVQHHKRLLKEQAADAFGQSF
jgi:DNA (cytosine-5)-methyltransferase 1